MAIRNEITIGANPLLNNLVMYRKVDNKPFTPEFTFDWFMSLARTPIAAQFGVMDAIEATLSGLPMDVPNGYHLQQSL